MPRSASRPASPVGISADVDVPVDGTADVHMPGIADCVMRKEYRITEYPISESFTVPDSRIGRRSAPTMVHSSATGIPLKSPSLDTEMSRFGHYL